MVLRSDNREKNLACGVDAHPASTILAINGVGYLFWAFGGIVTGLFVGLHILVPAMIVLCLAIVAIWLSSAKAYTNTTRAFTMIWFAITITGLAAFLIGMLANSGDMIGQIGIFAMILFILPVPFLSRHAPIESSAETIDSAAHIE